MRTFRRAWIVAATCFLMASCKSDPQKGSDKGDGAVGDAMASAGGARGTGGAMGAGGATASAPRSGAATHIISKHAANDLFTNIVQLLRHTTCSTRR